MEGAADRAEHSRKVGALSAWVGAHADDVGLRQYLADPPEMLPPEALDRMLHSASVGLPEMSMDEYLRQKGAMN